MKKTLLGLWLFGIFFFLNFKTVKASCSLEEQVVANNAAGAVNVVTDKLLYTYNIYDENANDNVDVNAYTGMIYVYNLTNDIYFKITDGSSIEKYTVADDIGGAVAVSTGSMAVVKNYNISIFNANNACNNAPIRTITVTLPRYNNFANYLSCQNYPDYYYCQQFLNSDLITEDQFQNGLAEYVKTHKSEEEKRHGGIIENAIKTLKKYWYVVIIIIIAIAAITIGIKKHLDEKRKQEVV